jgi:hypothetical protein
MIYSCPTYKCLSQPEARRLAELDEARGKLLRVFESEGQLVACFSWGAVSFPGELLPELRALIGKEIAILRLGRYHVREVDDA